MANIITLKPVIMPAQQRKDGTYNMKIRVTFHRKSRILSTNVTVPRKALSKDGEIRDKDILVKAYAITQEMQERLNQLSYYDLMEMDVDKIVEWIRDSGRFRLDFFEFARQFAESKNTGTKAVYTSAINAFRRFVGRDTMDISEITRAKLMDFEAYVNNETKFNTLSASHTAVAKKHGVSASAYMKRLSSIYRAAQLRYSDDVGESRIKGNPFNGIKVDYMPTFVRSNKTPEDIQRLIDVRTSLDEKDRFAVDMYLLSFMLMGMNMADMMTCAKPKNGVVTYNRMKTRSRRSDMSEHRIRVEGCMSWLIDEYADREGKTMLDLRHRYFKKDSCTDVVNYHLTKVAAQLGMDRFTMYSARHSWATIARSSKCGIDKSIVDECLVHVDSGMKMADVYIEKDWTVLWDANSKVLSLFDWSPLAPDGAVPHVDGSL